MATAMTILNHMVGHQRNAAQAVQATRILKKLEPDAQLFGVVRRVQQMEDDLNAVSYTHLTLLTYYSVSMSLVHVSRNI